MAVDQMIQKVQDALKLSNMKSKLPRDPKVVDIRVEDYVDTDGEDALARDGHHRREMWTSRISSGHDVTA